MGDSAGFNIPLVPDSEPCLSLYEKVTNKLIDYIVFDFDTLTEHREAAWLLNDNADKLEIVIWKHDKKAPITELKGRKYE